MFYEYKKNDEYTTPEYAVMPIIKYLKPKSKILCPFDKPESEYNKVLTKEGHHVICTHIENGKDFFKLKSANVDYIISNPPYSMKTEIFKHLFGLGVPFAMLVNLNNIFESERFFLFKEHNISMIVFDKRIYFKNACSETFRPPFSAGYICYKIMKEKIVYEEISKA